MSRQPRAASRLLLVVVPARLSSGLALVSGVGVASSVSSSTLTTSGWGSVKASSDRVRYWVLLSSSQLRARGGVRLVVGTGLEQG